MDQTAALLAFPRQPEDRLRLALHRLDEALAEQAAVVADFRASLAALRGATQGLAGQLRHYQDQLADTAGQLQQANHAARVLEQTADRMAALS